MNRSNYRREEHQLPSSTDGIVALVSSVLSQPGKVFKIVIDSDHGVTVYRERGTTDDLGEDATTLDAALRNSEIVEYENVGGNPFEKLVDMFYILHGERMHPVTWVSGNSQNNLLSHWLTLGERGLPVAAKHGEEILGVPLLRIPTLPEDVLILCGAPFSDADYKDVTIGVKTSVELRSEPSHEVIEDKFRAADRGGRAGEEGAPTAVGLMEAPVPRTFRSCWYPKDLFGIWLEDRFGIREGARESD